jgi:hypothetical protein
MDTTPISGLSEGLVFGGGYAWRLANARPSLAMIDPRTGKAIKTFAVPPPSATADDEAVAGIALLWVFRGSDLTVLSRSTGQAVGSSHVDPLAGSFGTVALVTGRTLWYLGQAPDGTSLDRVGLSAARSAASRARSSSVSPPAPGTAARAPVCAISQLKITLTRRGGTVTGQVGGYLRFANSGRVACQLHGWPTVTAVTGLLPSARCPSRQSRGRVRGRGTKRRQSPRGRLPRKPAPRRLRALSRTTSATACSLNGTSTRTTSADRSAASAASSGEPSAGWVGRAAATTATGSSSTLRPR